MTSFSSDRLQYYLPALLSATPEAACTLCLSATSDPHLFEFGELLSTPSVQRLHANPARRPYHDLVRLFAYGTVDDYRANPTAFPPLHPAHWDKLRVLTLLSLANGSHVLRYDELIERLGVAEVREVEQVVLQAVYAGLVRARMHQRERCLEIVGAVGRDVLPKGGVGDMIGVLRAWVERSAGLVREIDDRIAFIADHTASVKRGRMDAVEASRKHMWPGEAAQAGDAAPVQGISDGGVTR